MSIEDLVQAIERLHVAADEVLVVRPKALLTRSDIDILRRNLDKIADLLGISHDRIVIADNDLELTVVKADQMELG